jgi:hypothetical protein
MWFLFLYFFGSFAIVPDDFFMHSNRSTDMLKAINIYSKLDYAASLFLSPILASSILLCIID